VEGVVGWVRFGSGGVVLLLRTLGMRMLLCLVLVFGGRRARLCGIIRGREGLILR
jgi:hypothetical protein